MTTKLMEKPINPSTNIRIKKPNEISTNYNTKIEKTLQVDSSLKKIYLPAIHKRTMQTIPVSSLTRRMKKSQSQSNLINAYKKSNTFNPNTEKEKILLAKYSLSRINAKINDLTLNYKKLLVEKEDNLNIIKNAICSDDPTYAESIGLKIEQLLEDAMKNSNNNANAKNKVTISTTNYDNLKFSEDRNLKTEDTRETKDKINKTFVREETDNLNVKINPINEKEQENEDKNEEQKDNNNEQDKNNEKNENEKLLKSNNELNNNAEQNNNNEINKNNEEKNNIVEQNNNNNEEVKNNEENKENADSNNNANDINNNNVTNLEIKHKHDYSAETRGRYQ